MSTTTATAVATLVALGGAMFATAQPAGAATTMPVGTVVASTLVGRQAPTTRAPRVMVADQSALHRGQRVLLGCKVHGETVNGNDLWYRVVSPHGEAWISARYVRNNAVLPRWCQGNATTALTAPGEVRVKQAPTAQSPTVRTLRKGARATAMCRVEVQQASGTTQGWYYLDDGRWVPVSGILAAHATAPCH